MSTSAVTREACGWTFLTNHAHVLACLATETNPMIRDIAACVGITERSVQLILADLERDGVVRRHRVGRRSHYPIRRGAPLHHPPRGAPAPSALLRSHRG